MKERLDIRLVKEGLAPSREKAKALIMSGIVYVNGQKEDKPGTTFEETLPIEVKGNTLPYVSRGGLKLAKAIDSFAVELNGTICMDIGSSTGGFTDCMLQNGAVKVYAVDSGRGQLDWKLRNDSRVVCLERTNARYLNEEIIPEEVDFFSVDVCFISLTKILESAISRLKENGHAVCLIKPQFEAGREKVGKKGVVRDPKVHLEVVKSIMSYVKTIGFQILGLEFSPIKGPEGNIEYLLYVKKSSSDEGSSMEHIISAEQVVAQAHENLDH